MLKQLFKDTLHHANILLVVTNYKIVKVTYFQKSQSGSSHLQLNLPEQRSEWHQSTNRISNHFPSKIKTKFFNQKIYVQQKVSDKKIVIKAAKY